MRKDDHQITHPLYISQLVKGVKYNADSLDLGWKTVAKLSAAETELPSNCKMARP